MTTHLEVLLPDMDAGNKTVKATVSFWPVAVGASLQAGDDLLEVATDKANFVVPCPQTGILREQRVQEDDRVCVGDVIAIIEVAS